MDKWSPKKFGPPWTNDSQFGPRISGSPQHVPLDKWNILGTFSRGTKLVVDHLSMGTEFWGTICPWGLNLLGTVCPEGPIIWGPIVGDQMSWDPMRLGPNVSQSIHLC